MSPLRSEQIQGLLDGLGGSGFVEGLARTLLAAISADLVRIQECGIESGWRSTLAEVARDPTMLRLDDLRRAALPETMPFSKEPWLVDQRIAAGDEAGAQPAEATPRVSIVVGGVALSGRSCVVVALLGFEVDDGVLARRRAMLDRLLPLMRAFWHAHQRCLALESERNAMFQALDHRGLGAMTLDRHAAPISVNRRATEMMRQTGLLAFTPTRFVATDPNDARRMREVLSRVLHEIQDGQRGPARTMTLTDPEKHLALRVQVCPTAATLPSEGARTPTMVALIEDLQRDRRPDIRENAARFALTAVETELACRLVEGQALDRAAAEQRISIHTARKYLQQIFGKTQTSRQSDLVRLLISGALPSRPAADAPDGEPDGERGVQAGDALERRAAQ